MISIFENKREEKEAFTLIELLVVIAIIGILSSVVLAGLSGARESARDTKRLQDIRQINTAVQMYMNNNSGNPPLEGNSQWYSEQPAQGDDWGVLENKLMEYINPLPKDPINGNDQLYYFYRADGTAPGCGVDESNVSYVFLVRFESDISPDNYVLRSDQQPAYSDYCFIQ